MNRKERRANRRQDSSAAGADPLALAAAHLADGRPREAVKLLKPLLPRHRTNPAAHDIIGAAYQALGRRDDALQHFSEAIRLGMRGMDADVKQSPAMLGALGRFGRSYPATPPLAELLGADNAVAEDARLLALLQTEIVRDIELELFLTALRSQLLAAAAADTAWTPDGGVLGLICALAQQCFRNEYAFALSDAEHAPVTQLRERVVTAPTGAKPSDLAVLGCYEPLHGLPDPSALFGRSRPEPLDALLTLQVREPLAEATDATTIPSLTAVEDETSRLVQQQYEESPYPRWMVPLPTRPTTLDAFLRERFGIGGPFGGDILIAGCGTGEQSVNTAQTFPQAKVLAIDISRTSLAYARRKTRELRVPNIEYAQADILKLGSLDRRFDYIESVGVLHHLSDPEAGWRSLLPLLRRGGVMRIALYSETGRQPLQAARAVIAERGYRPIPDDIRQWRRELIQRGEVPTSTDFFSISSCRDLCFHVMEHRFTLPRIKRFLEANGLSMLGMETSAETRERFLRENPAPSSLTDLDRWDAFERANPRTFSSMYYLWLRFDRADAET